MRIHPDHLESTAFLCIDDRKGRTPRRIAAATAFFVQVPDDKDPATFWNYVVTARHCVRDRKDSETIYVRINADIPDQSAPQYIDLPTTRSQWHWLPNADVAAILLPETDAPLRFRTIKLPWFVSADYKFRPTGPDFGERLKQSARLGLSIEVGHTVFFTGLFAQSAGTKKNLAIARFGNLSRMPHDEMITIHSDGYGNEQIRAYLVECHSWGGHSGSPAFWHFEYSEARPVMVSPTEHETVLTTRSWVDAFLGLVSGHFDIPIQARHRLGEQDAITMSLNAGIAIVTPAEDVRALLMDTKEVRDDREDHRHADAHAATADLSGEFTSPVKKRKTRNLEGLGKGTQRTRKK